MVVYVVSVIMTKDSEAIDSRVRSGLSYVTEEAEGEGEGKTNRRSV